MDVDSFCLGMLFGAVLVNLMWYGRARWGWFKS